MKMKLRYPYIRHILLGIKGVKIIEFNDNHFVLDVADEKAKALVQEIVDTKPLVLFPTCVKMYKEHVLNVVIELSTDHGTNELEAVAYFDMEEACKGSYVDGLQQEPDTDASCTLTAVEIKRPNGYLHDISNLLTDQQTEALEEQYMNEGG